MKKLNLLIFLLMIMPIASCMPNDEIKPEEQPKDLKVYDSYGPEPEWIKLKPSAGLCGSDKVVFIVVSGEGNTKILAKDKAELNSINTFSSLLKQDKVIESLIKESENLKPGKENPECETENLENKSLKKEEMINLKKTGDWWRQISKKMITDSKEEWTKPAYEHFIRLTIPVNALKEKIKSK